ncbi:MAG: imidazoleglycerol-phosphate dehydratase [Crenarchaeota archaeon]|nr:imidazoleglycerol-phosphate dehydratase [Thermoproteota archaeon]
MRRETRETYVAVESCKESKVEIEIPFLKHMLETLIKHSGLGLCIEGRDLLGYDDHHLVEDVAIVLGRTLRELAREASEEGRLERFAWSLVPMDEALALCSADFSGRGSFHGELSFARDEIGGLALENVGHFFETLAREAGMTLHLRLLAGSNDHHKAEALFKAFAKCLSQMFGTRGGISAKGFVDL